MLLHNFDFSIARPPTAREAAAMQARVDRLQIMEPSVGAAIERFRELIPADRNPNEGFRLRHGFVRLKDPDDGVDTTTRNAAERRHRPPATRVQTSRGRSLSFLLIALCTTQLALAPGEVAPKNAMPLSGRNVGPPGWTDLIATDAYDATEGKVFVAVRRKKLRQIHTSLATLDDQNLVCLPDITDRHRRYEEFQLLREDARATGDNDVYWAPAAADDFFTVPLTLFTNGWIHVLQDSELALLLITARLREKYGDEAHAIGGGGQKLNYGLSRDSFEAAHRVLDYLGIVDVVSDYMRSADGKVDAYKKRGAKPHLLRFHPEALDSPAYPAIVETLSEQLKRAKL
jgi:hypothetical protein